MESRDNYGLKLNRALLVAGKICSGKSTILNAVSSVIFWPVVSFGSYVREETRKRNLPVTRDSFQQVGKDLYESLGARKFLLEVLKFSLGTDQADVLFDGVRHKSILLEIQNMFQQVFVIYLDCDQESRYKRFLKRQVDGDQILSLNEFLKMDAESVESEIEFIKSYANFVIDSSQPLQSILLQVDGLLISQRLK